jgi:hypothetical protein
LPVLALFGGSQITILCSCSRYLNIWLLVFHLSNEYPKWRMPINWCVGLHSSSYCPCMLHYPWQYKDFWLKLHIKDYFWSIWHLFKITHQIYKT